MSSALGTAPAPIDGLAPFSVNAQRVFDAAVAEANRRRHAVVGSEHLLWALVCYSRKLGDRPRVVDWLCDAAKLTPDELGRAVERDLEKRPLWKELSVEDASESTVVSRHTPELSSSVQTAFRLLAQFSSGTVQDPALGLVHHGGLVATEFIIVCLLLEGTNVAADVLQRLSHGAINSKAALRTINVDPATIIRPALKEQTWQVFGIGDPPSECSTPWCPASLPEYNKLPKAPTPRSNWLVPDRLLIGAKPGGYYSDSWPDVQAYLAVGITTFVCLIGEFSSTEAFRRNYPSQLAKHKRSAQFIHFGIRDFETVSQEQLQPFVLELSRRLRKGDRLFVHCLGGHGRTGMVVIPLVAALFDLEYEVAESFVQDATAQGREEDRRHGYVHSMPETDEQADIAAGANLFVRKRKR